VTNHIPRPFEVSSVPGVPVDRDIEQEWKLNEQRSRFHSMDSGITPEMEMDAQVKM
jgi:hypothetical protein